MTARYNPKPNTNRKHNMKHYLVATIRTIALALAPIPALSQPNSINKTPYPNCTSIMAIPLSLPVSCEPRPESSSPSGHARHRPPRSPRKPPIEPPQVAPYPPPCPSRNRPHARLRVLPSRYQAREHPYQGTTQSPNMSELTLSVLLC